MTRLERWKTTEPVRLYLWSTGLLLLAPILAAAAWTGAWQTAGSVLVALAVMLGLGGEAARASVYSPAAVMAERVNAAAQAQLQRSLW